MNPVELSTPRLVLDQPTVADRDLIIEYCRDPLFEHFMVLPWPYEPQHADYFLESVVADGWATGREYTWALRRDGEFLGAIGYRSEDGDIGYWLGAPHRGNGYMTEALRAVNEWLFGQGVREISWWCVLGNAASASVARKAGFRFDGEGPSVVQDRDGGHPMSWHATLRAGDAPGPKPGWPAPAPPV